MSYHNIQNNMYDAQQINCMQFDIGFIRKLKSGNKKCFENLFLNTYQPLCDYALSITKSIEDAEGAVQDVFTALWICRSTLDEDTNIKAYLFKSVKNRSLDILQHKRIREKYKDQLTAMYESTSDETEFNSNIIKRVREEVENLPEKCKIVYLLHRRDGLTYTEIAQVLEISVKAVEARMSKALNILRTNLEKETKLNLLPLLAILTI
jgi:RNA polymerase sigma-70 factor (family 1)